MSDSTKTTASDLEKAIFQQAIVLRKSLNPEANYKIVLALLFIKRLNDTFLEQVEKNIENGMSEKDAENPRRYDYFIPPEGRWQNLANAGKNIGSALVKVCKSIEGSAEILNDTMSYKEFTDKKKYPDSALRDLINIFNKIELGNNSLESSDIIGNAYEYVLQSFADETKKRGGQFFTPREVVELLVELVEPQADQRVCDPNCGSGGMLIYSRNYAEKHLKKGQNIRNMTLHGQDSNPDTVSMCKMNMVLHNITDVRIEDGDSLENPQLIEGSKLILYDRVLANFPFSESWKPGGKENDTFGRFRYGIPPADKKADFAFIQHMLTSLNENGKAAIISGQGTLFRGSKEEQIRKRMILGDQAENLQGDVIEGIIALPPALFYGTTIPGCIYILNKNKPKERKNKIIFIHAARSGHFADLPARNKLRISDIGEIVSAFKNFKDEYGFCHVADLAEIEENEFNLNVPRYVDTSIPEEPVDILEIIEKINELEKVVNDSKEKVNKDLEELQLGAL